MERRAKAVCIGLFAVFAALPFLIGLCRLCGISVTFRYGFIIGLLHLAAALAAEWLLGKYDRDRECTASGFLSLTPILTVINWMLLLSYDDVKSRGSGMDELLPIFDLILLVVMISCFVVCVFLRSKYVKSGRVRTVSIAVPIVIISLIGSVMFPLCFLGNIGESAVVSAVPSPDGRHYAELIDDDQGALGGNTLVDVYRRGALDLGFVRFCSVPKRVYHGDWGEFENMRLEWKDNETLLINGKEYPAG